MKRSYLSLVLLLVLIPILFVFIAYLLIKRFSKRIKNEDELKKRIEFWKKELNLSHTKIYHEIDPKCSTAEVNMVKPGREYKIKLNLGSLSGRDFTLVHELLHIKKGHCDLPEMNNRVFRFLINFICDIIVNISIIKIWKSSRRT